MKHELAPAFEYPSLYHSEYSSPFFSQDFTVATNQDNFIAHVYMIVTFNDFQYHSSPGLHYHMQWIFFSLAVNVWRQHQGFCHLLRVYRVLAVWNAVLMIVALALWTCCSAALLHSSWEPENIFASLFQMALVSWCMFFDYVVLIS